MIRDMWQVTRSENQFQAREVESRRVTEELEKNLAVDKEEYGRIGRNKMERTRNKNRGYESSENEDEPSGSGERRQGRSRWRISLRWADHTLVLEDLQTWGARQEATLWRLPILLDSPVWNTSRCWREGKSNQEKSIGTQ
jgi:hypothetical protein